MSKSKDSGKDFKFGDMVKNLKTLNPNSSVFSENTFGVVKEYIHTGNYILNALISGSLKGGIPAGRITALAGDSGVGKSYLCLNAAANAQKQGYYVVYFDTEVGNLLLNGKVYEGIDNETFNSFGVDTDRLLYAPAANIEDIQQQMVSIINEAVRAKRSGKYYEKVLIILDSIGNIGTLAALEKMEEGAATKDMTKAGKIRNLFQAITVSLGELDWPLVIVNHVIANIGGYGASKVQTGGSGMAFNPTTTVFFSKSKEKEGTKQVGINVKAKTDVKNRLAPPGEIQFQIKYAEGMNPYIGLEDYISWENCGIGKGKIEDGEYKPGSASSRTIAVAHLGKHFSSAKEIFNEDVFNDEVIDMLDEIVKKDFSYGKEEDFEKENNID